MVHGCTIGDGSLIGIQAVVMNGAVIGRESIVGAGAIVTEGKRFPERSLILGAPAKVVRELTEADLKNLAAAADGYVQRASVFRNELERRRLNRHLPPAPTLFHSTRFPPELTWQICSTTRWV
jgi:carbonic anhydrase/acetyltransferase-like protein (isoleucine patch superfamily)